MIFLKTLYKGLFKKEDQAIKQWLKDIKKSELSGGNILITALRNGTWIEWAVYSACVLRQMGYRPIILYSLEDIERSYGSIRSYFWRKAKDIPDIKFIDIDGFDCDKLIKESYLIENPLFIYDAIAYNYHIERKDIMDERKKYQLDILNLISFSAKSASALKYAIETYKPHRFICYSGLIENTPTLLSVARNMQVETVCVEGWAWRAGHVIYNFNKPALEYNILSWMNYYGWNSETEKTIDEYLAFQDGKADLKKINWLNGFYNVQQSSLDDTIDEDIKSFIHKHAKSFLLAPNVIGDSSTLNRETIFESQMVWIKEIIEYFKVHPQYSLIIRAHPAEVWVKEKVVIKLGEYAAQLSEGIENILIIKSSNKINSFSLIPHIRCGLIWLSSIGVDLVARNVPILCAASAKYDEIGIMDIPKSKEEYFDMVEKYGNAVSTSTNELQKLNAKKYLYTVFKGFSYPAQGNNFGASSLILNNMPEQEEHDKFYKIITGELSAHDIN
jgi:hypothetical protein